MKSRRPISMRVILYWFSRVVLGVIFIYAAILKLGAPQEFADSLASYGLLPTALINLVAWGLPLFEFACGFLVLSGYRGRAGALSMIALLALFCAATLAAIMRGVPVNCGCFGRQSLLDASPWMVISRDIGLLGCAIYIYGIYMKKEMELAGSVAAQKSIRISTE